MNLCKNISRMCYVDPIRDRMFVPMGYVDVFQNCGMQIDYQQAKLVYSSVRYVCWNCLCSSCRYSCDSGIGDMTVRKRQAK